MISLCFTGGNYRGVFALGLVQSEWKMYVKGLLDREERNLYIINVTASDGLFVSQATVEVTVLDANDNKPICDQVTIKLAAGHCLCFWDALYLDVSGDYKLFQSECSKLVSKLHELFNPRDVCLSVFGNVCPQALYTASVAENIPVNSVVLRVGATDEDVGISAWIQYSLHGLGSHDFSIDPDTGMNAT